MKRDRVIEIVLVLIVVALAAALLYRELGAPAEPASHPIATALMQETEEEGDVLAWPPTGAALADTIVGTQAIEAIERSADYDAGVDAAHFDAGAPLPEPPPEAPDFRVRQGEEGGIFYLEVVIGEATFDDTLPMLVVLHGRGGSAQIPGGPFLGLTHPVRVIVPQAPDPLGSGYEWLPVYVGQGLVDRLSSTLFQTASRLATLMRDLSRERPTTGRVIVSGFSQGGLLTLALALFHDDVVGEAFPLASWLPPPLEPLYRRSDLAYPRIRSMHGTADPTIPIEPTRQLFARLATRGFDVAFVPFDGVVHTISDDENALFHVWLEAAVCRAAGDRFCEEAAEHAATELRPDALTPDAGAEDAAIVPDAYVEDAGTDAGRARRRRPIDAGL
jgi:phospholipase/carboxylesterase